MGVEDGEARVAAEVAAGALFWRFRGALRTHVSARAPVSDAHHAEDVVPLNLPCVVSACVSHHEITHSVILTTGGNWSIARIVGTSRRQLRENAWRRFALHGAALLSMTALTALYWSRIKAL